MGHAGTAIRTVRQARGISLRDLAHLSGTSYSYLSRVERGKAVPTDRWLRAVETALAHHMLGDVA